MQTPRDLNKLYVEWAGRGRQSTARKAGHCRECGTPVRPTKRMCWDCEAAAVKNRQRARKAELRAMRKQEAPA